ncbi:MAG: hypothetical protein IH859_03520 [Chloroflexi bacterium]|nr:hypothetical protein [Chloroflexota bacterium]
MIKFKDSEPDPGEDNKRWYQQGDFWIGFVGWFLVNIFLFGLQGALNLNPLFAFAINVVGITVLFIVRPRIAKGVLGAFGSLLALTLCAGIVVTAICFSGGVL